MSNPKDRIAELNSVIADLAIQLKELRDELKEINTDSDRYFRWWQEEEKRSAELSKQLAQYTDAKTKSDV